PVYAFVFSLDAPRQLSDLWFSLLTIHLLSWAFLSLAAFIVPRAWQEGPVFKRNVFWNKPLPTFLSADSVKRAELRAQLLEINPILWLAGRQDRQRDYLWAAIVVFLTFLLVRCLLTGMPAQVNSFFRLYGPIRADSWTLFHLLLKVWMCLQA